MQTFLIVFSVVFVIGLLIRILPHIVWSKSISDEEFVCPNCQKRFHPNFFSVYVQHEIIEMSDKGKFKCPHCKIKDTCHRPH